MAQYRWQRGTNNAYRTNASSHEPIHSKSRINWFILGSWSAILLLFLAFWDGVGAMIAAIAG